MQTSFAAPTLERVEKPVVVHEKILPSQRTEVQPVIHRDREQMEVHKVVQPLHERDVAPTQHQYVQLPAENYQSRAPDTEFQNQYRDVNSRIHSETFTAPMTTEQIQKPAIIEETIHKKIIEEVQPVLYRETLKPVVVEATKPIYEKVVEAPRLVEEIRPMVDLGTKFMGGQETAFRSTEMQQQPTAYIHEKITVITKEQPPMAQNLAGEPLVGKSEGHHHCSYFDKQKAPLTTEGTKSTSTITPTETRTI